MVNYKHDITLKYNQASLKWDVTGYWIQHSGIILCMCPANDRPRYIVTWSLIGWAHTQNYSWTLNDKGRISIKLSTYKGHPINQPILTSNSWIYFVSISIKSEYVTMISTVYGIWVRSWRYCCFVNWFCYHLIAKPGNKTAEPSWPDPYFYATEWILGDGRSIFTDDLHW